MMSSKIAGQLLLKKNLKLFQVGLFKNSPNPLSSFCNQLSICLLGILGYFLFFDLLQKLNSQKNNKEQK